MSAGSLARRFAQASGISSGRVSRVILATLFFFLLPVAANAYTLVLRSGRHVTVPADFRVTPAAVVYEASPGFSVTVWLTNVDLAATERANAEPAGSFVTRIRQEPNEGAAAPTPVKAAPRAGTRVVTNKEIEPLRLRREAQEAEYERTRRERGMPSKRELQRRFEEQDRRLRELTLQMQAERAESELESVKSELFNVRRELDELGSRLSYQPGAYTPVYSSPNYYPYYYYTPPVQFINRFPFSRHGGFGRGSFRPHPYGRARSYNPWQGRPFPSLGWPTLNGNNPPLAPASRMPASRR